MAIDLSRLNNPPAVSSTTRSSSTKENSAVSADVGVTKTAAVSSGEPVTLSDGAQQLQKITDKLKDQPTVDSARVAALKQSIDAGTYAIDPAKIADKMRNFEAQR